MPSHPELIDELTWEAGADDATPEQVSSFASLYAQWTQVSQDFATVGPDLYAAARAFEAEGSLAYESTGDIEALRGWAILARQADDLYREWSQAAGQVSAWESVFSQIRERAQALGRWAGFGAVPLGYVLLASAVSVLTFLIAFGQGARQAASYYVGLLNDIRARRKTVDEAIVEGEAFQASIPSTPGEFFGALGTGIETVAVGLGQGLLGLGLIAVTAMVLWRR